MLSGGEGAFDEVTLSLAKSIRSLLYLLILRYLAHNVLVSLQISPIVAVAVQIESSAIGLKPGERGLSISQPICQFS